MSEMNRRDFLGGISAGTLGTVGAMGLILGAQSRCSKAAAPVYAKPLETKLNVRPVYAGWIYDGRWEGPCRWDIDALPDISGAEQRVRLEKRFQDIMQNNNAKLGDFVNLLDPVFVEYHMHHEFGESELQQLAAGDAETEVYIVNGNKHPQQIACLVGERFNKPSLLNAGSAGHQRSRDVSAFFRSRGMPGFNPITVEEVDDVLRLFWANKVFRNQRTLYITNRGGKVGRISNSNVWNWKEMDERLGLSMKVVTYEELGEEIDRVRSDAEMIKTANAITDQLIQNAQDVRMDREEIVKSVDYYIAVQNLMEKYNCMAHTIECFEFCESKMAQKWRIVPCLTNCLFKDQGIMSACEGDLNAMMAMGMLMYASGRAAHMGNFYFRGDDVAYMGHNVPPLKALGFDQPDVPYAIQNFVLSGWGAKIQVDFAALPEKTVTIARVDPNMKKILLIKGEITGCVGHDKPGCSLITSLTIPDTHTLVRKTRDYGFHFAMVVGDFAEQTGDLAELLGMEAEYHNV